ncbi:MAG: hypothetical protein CBC34_002055 [Hyphomicrobiaceae bacterium TMED74]|nr:hypothetical protein [Filomicrobium sp.]RPG47017.1 MAG: hypothetical protein CBC34_002055 [Hyphomicrobiaceae bacterium TMED74]
MSKTTWAPEIADCSAVLADMDGVLVLGANAAPGAGALLQLAGEKLVVVTNESARSSLELSCDFRDRGLAISPEQIVTAGERAIEELKLKARDACIMVRGAPILQSMVTSADLRLWSSGDKADVVLLGRDPNFGPDALVEATRAIEDGAQLWVTNTDLRHPVGNGRYTYQTGALLAALRACVGDVPMTVVGKPSPGLFHDALRLLDARPQDAIMIGDNPVTDGLGAEASGIRFIEIGNSHTADAISLDALLASAN